MIILILKSSAWTWIFMKRMCCTKPRPTTQWMLSSESRPTKIIKATNARLLLVELRMGYESAKRLSKEEIEGKSTHTKALLSGEKAIHRISFFVFTKKVAPLARNWFERQQRTGGEIKNCQSCAVSEFNDMVKSIADSHARMG